MIEIDKNVEIPPKIKVHHRAVYPFRDLEVGDSFMVECSPIAIESMKAKLYNRSYYWSNLLGHKHVVRPVDGGVRVWRTA